MDQATPIPRIQRATVIADLILQGWAESARRVYRKARQLDTMRLMVWVDAHGLVWVKGISVRDQFLCPAHEHIGTYDKRVEINVIEDDLLFHLRAMTGTAQRNRRVA